jgi:Glycosyl transferase family 2
MTASTPTRGEHSVCFIVTLKASLADTLSFVYYHLNSEVDHLYLFFDDPTDPAIDALVSERQVTCIRCDANHWQSLVGNLPRSQLSINVKQEANARQALQMARQDGFAWVGHIDSDELVYAPGGLRHLIAAIPPGVDVLKFPVLEVVPECTVVQSAFHELHYFIKSRQTLPKNHRIILDPRERLAFFLQVLSYRMRQVAAGLLGCGFNFNQFIKGHSMGKSIARTRAPIVSFRSHYPIPARHNPLQINLLSNGMILHYDFPDYEHWLNKWRNRYLTFQQGITHIKLSKNRQKQYEEFVHLYEKGSEADLQHLFKESLLVPERARRILTHLQLASKIHLSAHLFDPPPEDSRSAGSQGEGGD